jgi:chromosome segregation ATPase
MSSGFRQTNELWKDIQDETSPDIKRLKMIEMAKLLLKYASLTDDQLADLSGSETLTDFFLEYHEIGKSTADFFKHAIAHLEPELAGGEFQTELEAIEKELSDITEKYKNFKNEYAQLLTQKEQLLESSEKLHRLEAEIDELKQLEANLKPEYMASLSQEIADLKQQVEKDRPEYEKLLSEKNTLDDLHQHMKTMTQSASESHASIDHAELISHARQLSDILDQEWDHIDERLSQELRKLKQRNKIYNEVLVKIDDTLAILNQTTECEKENRIIYESHFNENEQLVKGFSSSHIQAEKPVQQRIDNLNLLSGQIKESLEKFDQEITEAINENEAIIGKIRRLNQTTL